MSSSSMNQQITSTWSVCSLCYNSFTHVQASIDSLAAAIKEFEGGVVIVSHDFRALVESKMGFG